jgi:hypothetical protein
MRCMMQPIIFLMLIIVGLSQKIFFSRLPPFFLLTLGYVLLKRGRLRCGGG